jgi:vitamin B12 transporter
VKLEGINDSFAWAVVAYKSDFTNLFSFNPNTFLAANVGEAEIEGVEASLSTSIADWDFSVNADLLSAKNVQTGLELDDRAEQTIALKASKDFGAFDLLFNLKSESNRFDRSGTELSSYTLFDVAANYDVNDKVRISANVDNLFDKDFTLNLINSTERYNTEGRQAKISVKVSF